MEPLSQWQRFSIYITRFGQGGRLPCEPPPLLREMCTLLEKVALELTTCFSTGLFTFQHKMVLSLLWETGLTQVQLRENINVLQTGNR